MESTLRSRWQKWKATWAHAFDLGPQEEPLSPEEIALLEKVASLVVRREMETPALIFLESFSPLSFLGSQALYFLRPILELGCNPHELEKMASILERREGVSTLIEIIEAQATGGKR